MQDVSWVCISYVSLVPCHIIRVTVRPQSHVWREKPFAYLIFHLTVQVLEAATSSNHESISSSHCTFICWNNKTGHTTMRGGFTHRAVGAVEVIKVTLFEGGGRIVQIFMMVVLVEVSITTFWHGMRPPIKTRSSPGGQKSAIFILRNHTLVILEACKLIKWDQLKNYFTIYYTIINQWERQCCERKQSRVKG